MGHYNRDAQRKLFEMIGAQLGVSWSETAGLLPEHIELPTRYESPTHYIILDRLIKRIKNSADKYGLDTSDFPYHSSIPTGLVNAQAVRLPCSRKDFILFDSQIFNYCHLFAKAFALCLPVVSREGHWSFSIEIEDVKKRVTEYPECIDRLVDLLGALDETTVPGMAAPYVPEPEYAHLSSLYRDGMELFIVGHEFGHVYAKHLNLLLPRRRAAEVPNEDLNASHVQEFEADSIGLLLMISAQAEQGYDAGLSYIGAELFFHALELQERFSHLQAFGASEDFIETRSSSHPSNRERREALRVVVTQALEQGERLQATLQLAARYEEVIEMLWDAVQRRYA